MSEDEVHSVSSVSRTKTLDEIADFWDSHSLADHWDESQEAHFEVRAARRRRVALDPEVYAQLEALARVKGISSETLANLWLAERLRHGEHGP